MNCLTSIIPCVNDHPIAFIQLLRPSKVSRYGHQMAEQRFVLSDRFGLRGDMDLGNDQQVSWGLRVDIGKSDTQLVFVDSASRDLSGDDLTEQTISTHLYGLGPLWGLHF